MGTTPMVMPVLSFWPLSRGEKLVPQRERTKERTSYPNGSVECAKDTHLPYANEIGTINYRTSIQLNSKSSNK